MPVCYLLPVFCKVGGLTITAHGTGWLVVGYLTVVSVLQTNITRIEVTIVQHQLREARHVIRVPNSRLPKQALLSQLCQGAHSLKGGQRKPFRDVLRANLKKKCIINVSLRESC